jgi:plasmid stabilization system protein ParE
MSYSIKFTPDALLDYKSSCDYFEEYSLTTKENFEKAINEKLQFIANNPDAAPPIYKNVRVVLVKKFRFKIVYRVEPNYQRLIILVIVHQSRDSKFWEERII